MLMGTRTGQCSLECGELMGGIVRACLGLQDCLNRAVQGRMQMIGDQMGDQYSPGLTKRNESMLVSHDRIEETMSNGTNPSTTTVITGGFQEMNAYKTVRPLDEERWPE